MATYLRKKYKVHFFGNEHGPQEHMLTFFDVVTLRALACVNEQGIQIKELTTRAREYSKEIDKISILTPIRTLSAKGLMIDVMRHEAVTLKPRHFFSPVVHNVEEVKVVLPEPQDA